MAPGARYSNPVGADLLKPHIRNVERHIRRQIGGGIVDFVQDLLLDGAKIDDAAGVFWLGENERPVLGNLGNRKADVVEVRHVFPSRIGEIPSGHLRPTLKQVTNQNPGRQSVPIVGLPTKMCHQRPESQGGISDTPCDNHLRTLPDGIADGSRPDIDIAGNCFLFVEALPAVLSQRFGVGQADGGAHIVAFDQRNSQIGDIQLLSESGNRQRGSGWVGTPEVADDHYSCVNAFLQDRPQHLLEQWFVTLARIEASGHMSKRKRPFTDRLEDQRSAGTGCNDSVHNRFGSIGSVTGKSSTTSNAKQGRPSIIDFIFNKIIDNVNDRKIAQSQLDDSVTSIRIEFRGATSMRSAAKRSKTGVTARSSSWRDLLKRLQLDIISGQYRPRERLIEDDIIAVTGSTRHAVRRALDELERMGLAIRKPNRGVQVRDYSDQEVHDLYELRECLESTAARRFAFPTDPALIDDLSQLAEEHQSASRNQRFADMFELNNAFHETLYDAAGNRQMAEAIRHYTFATHPIRAVSFPDGELREVAIRDHWDMIEAIKTHDNERLAETIVAHIRRPKDLYLKSRQIELRAPI